MKYRTTNQIAAVFVTAVMLIGLVTGCVTSRDAAEIKAGIAELKSQLDENQVMVARMDSLVAVSTESNRKLQNDVRSSTDELTRQLTQLLENHNDLMTRMDQVALQRVVRISPTSSPGAQAGVATGSSNDQAPFGGQESPDCIEAYDNAFTQTRRGEYETAIGEFKQYLASCSGHEDAENAYFWMGECYYALDKYSDAVLELEKLLKQFPESRNLGRALYKLARCKQELGKTSEAKAIYQRLVDEYAGTFEGEKAAEFIKEL